MEEVPAEISLGISPFESMWTSLMEVDLSENSLFKTRELFETISCLGSHLKRLDISGNSLAGTIPDCAEELRVLECLKASRNQLEGITEQAAAGWTKLSVLKLDRNAITTLPVSSGSWTSITLLDLRCNQLTQFEESCGSWDQLTTIHVGSNKLTHLPSSIGKWKSLKGLYITDNKIGELPIELSNCSNLEILHAGVNLLKELSPDMFGTGCFQSMRELELYRNKILVCPDELGSDMPLLEQISLSGNAIKAIPIGLGQCTALKELHFANISKLSKVPEDLAGCGKLVYLNVAGCPTVKSLPNTLAASWSELREIDVRSGGKKEKCKVRCYVKKLTYILYVANKMLLLCYIAVGGMDRCIEASRVHASRRHTAKEKRKR